MRVHLQYSPFPVHVPFHMTMARQKAAFGSVGSGKTIALCADGIRHMLEWPGSEGLLTRLTIPSLRDSTEAEFVGILGTPQPDANPGDPTLLDLCKVRRGGNHITEIVFPNGSVMRFRSIDSWTKIMSMNLSWIGLDEANEFDLETYVALVSRLRRYEPLPHAKRLGYAWPKQREAIKQQIALAANSHGHNWMWDWFVGNPREGTRYFKSSSFDNPTLYDSDGRPGGYLRSLLNMPPVWVRRFVFCEFDAFAGQIFQLGAQHQHPAFDPPAHWERAMGMDWGLRSAVALVWWAREPGTSKWFQYREWSTFNYFNPTERDSATTPTVDYVAKVIKELEKGEHIKYRAADPDIWRRRTGDVENVHIATSFATRHGIYFQAGAAGYDHRIEALNSLVVSEDLSIGDNCPITMTAMQQYQWEDLNVQSDKDAPEKPRKKNDHHVDASQYLATLFTTSRMKPEPPPKLSRDELILKRIKDQLTGVRPRT